MESAGGGAETLDESGFFAVRPSCIFTIALEHLKRTPDWSRKHNLAPRHVSCPLRGCAESRKAHRWAASILSLSDVAIIITGSAMFSPACMSIPTEWNGFTAWLTTFVPLRFRTSMHGQRRASWQTRCSTCASFQRTQLPKRHPRLFWPGFWWWFGASSQLVWEYECGKMPIDREGLKIF